MAFSEFPASAPGITAHDFKRTKILATLGPATDSYEQVLALLKAGANGFRLNFSHGDHAEHARRLGWARQASQELGKPVAILQDLQGPKIRLGDFEGRIELTAGDTLRLGYLTDYAGSGIVPMQYDLAQKVAAGERIYFFDGRVRGRVTGVYDGVVEVKVENSGYVVKRKGINLPDTNFGGDILTEKDLRDAAFGATQDIDYVAMSFVQRAADVERLRELLRSHGSAAKVIAKIETQAAIDPAELEKIVQASDAVMVARGDLAVEVSAEVVPIVQRRIIGLCQQYGKISIVATQMLISMVDNPEPTRPEVSDIANAVICGADCLMLSDETASGTYPREAVATMKRVILYTQEHAPVQPVYAAAPARGTLQDAITGGVMALAGQVGAAAIVAQTKSGATALSIASRRPAMPIVVVTSTARVATQLAIMYGSKTFLRGDEESVGARLTQWLKEQGVFEAGDRVVIVSGKQPGLIGGTDTIKVRVLE